MDAGSMFPPSSPPVPMKTRAQPSTSLDDAGAAAAALLPAFSLPSAKQQSGLDAISIYRDVSRDFYPSPLPTSERNDTRSSSPPRGIVSSDAEDEDEDEQIDAENVLTTSRGRASSPEIQLRALKPVVVVRVPTNGEPVLLGRSSQTCEFALRPTNKLASRVHARVSYNKDQDLIKIVCLGWNGLTVGVPDAPRPTALYEVVKDQAIYIEAVGGVSINVHGDRALVELDADTSNDATTDDSADATEDELPSSPEQLRIAREDTIDEPFGMADADAGDAVDTGAVAEPEPLTTTATTASEADLEKSEPALEQISSEREPTEQPEDVEKHPQTEVAEVRRLFDKPWQTTSNIRRRNARPKTRTELVKFAVRPNTQPAATVSRPQRRSPVDLSINKNVSARASAAPIGSDPAEAAPELIKKVNHEQLEYSTPETTESAHVVTKAPVAATSSVELTGSAKRDAPVETKIAQKPERIAAEAALPVTVKAAESKPNDEERRRKKRSRKAQPKLRLNPPRALKRVAKDEEIATSAKKLRVEDEEEIANIVINLLAFSRLSTTPLSTIKSSSARLGNVPKPELRRILEAQPCVGVITAEGVDWAGRPLEPEYYYNVENDKDEQRRLMVESAANHRSLRNCRRSTHKEFFYYTKQ